MKILHEKYCQKTGKNPKTTAEVEGFKDDLHMAASQNRELQPHVGKVQDILNPRKVLQLFRRIPDSVKG